MEILSEDKNKSTSTSSEPFRGLACMILNCQWKEIFEVVSVIQVKLKIICSRIETTCESTDHDKKDFAVLQMIPILAVSFKRSLHCIR